MNSPVLNIYNFQIKPFGDCTALWLERLPKDQRSYNHLLVSAKMFDLREFLIDPDDPHFFEIVRITSSHFHERGHCVESTDFWVSGIVKKIPTVSFLSSQLAPQPCITSFNFLNFHRGEELVNLSFIEADEVFVSAHDQTFCLFLGSYTQ